MVALLAAAAAGWWLSAPTDWAQAPVVTARSPGSKPAPAAPAGTATAAAAAAPGPAGRRASPWPEPDAAGLRAWAGAGPAVPATAPRSTQPSAAKAVVAVAASAPPRAPAPAWRFVGRIHDGTAVRAMLVTAQQLRVVAEQESLDTEWRVERISDQGVDLIWLPGEQRVRLAWASS